MSYAQEWSSYVERYANPGTGPANGPSGSYGDNKAGSSSPMDTSSGGDAGKTGKSVHSRDGEEREGSGGTGGGRSSKESAGKKAKGGNKDGGSNNEEAVSFSKSSSSDASSSSSGAPAQQQPQASNVNCSASSKVVLGKAREFGVNMNSTCGQGQYSVQSSGLPLGTGEVGGRSGSSTSSSSSSLMMDGGGSVVVKKEFTMAGVGVMRSSNNSSSSGNINSSVLMKNSNNNKCSKSKVGVMEGNSATSAMTSGGVMGEGCIKTEKDAKN